MSAWRNRNGAATRNLSAVLAGLVPAIHALQPWLNRPGVDAPDKRGHDDGTAGRPTQGIGRDRDHISAVRCGISGSSAGGMG